MQKHGYSDADVTHNDVEDVEIAVERITVAGKYRVRRLSLLHAIAGIHSCVGYRDDDENNACVMVLYGRPNDIFATKTLFAAAEALAIRSIPTGDRSWRVSWWKGFQRGIEEVLSVARRDYVGETPGVGLVLADRAARAQKEMRATAPPLRGTYSYVDTAQGAYKKGKEAGQRFGAAGRTFGVGVRGELQ